MRESIGATWFMGLAIIFIVIITLYLTVNVSFIKAFKTKNAIINIIEQNEGYSTTTEKEVSNYIKRVGYNSENNNDTIGGKKIVKKCVSKDAEYKDGGYCVGTETTSQGKVYKVTTFIPFQINIGFFDFSIYIPVSGETVALYYTYD